MADKRGILFSPTDTPQQTVQKLNSLVQMIGSDLQTDKLRVGAGGIWANDGGITATDVDADSLTVNTITIPTGAVSGYALVCDADGVASWAEAAGGSEPGGSSGQIQYNNAGALGGMAGSLWDGNDLVLPTSIQASGDLQVVSDLEVLNELKGSRCLLPFGVAMATVTSDRYLNGAAGASMSGTRGYCMARAGSVVGVSLSFSVTSYTPVASVSCYVHKNGVATSLDCGASLSGGTPAVFNHYAMLARNNVQFAAGDVVQAYLDVSGTVQIGPVSALIEVQFDT